MKGILIPLLLCMAVVFMAGNASPILQDTVKFNGTPQANAIVQVTQNGTTTDYYTNAYGIVTIYGLQTGSCHVHAAKKIGGTWKEDNKDLTLVDGWNIIVQNLHDPD